MNKKFGWSSGLTKETDDRVLRMSLAKTGKKLSEEHKNRIRLSKIKPKQMRVCKCGKQFRVTFASTKKYCCRSCINKGRIHTKEQNIKVGNILRGRKRPEHSEAIKLDKHPNWQGGKSFEPYGLEWNHILRKQIRERDKFTCQECKMSENQLGYPLSVHHIDYDKKNNSINNLISLCKSCHSQTNYKRNNWIDYYKRKICLIIVQK